MDAKFIDLIQQDRGIAAIEYLIECLPRQVTHGLLDRCSDAMRDMSGEVRETYAYGIGLFCYQGGDSDALSLWYKKNRGVCRAMVLNACWGQPSTQEIGERAVELSIVALGSKVEKVRAEACSVLQNQAGWKIDVSVCLSYLPDVMADSSGLVRMMSACLIGNLAKGKAYNLEHCCDGMMALVVDQSGHVRRYAVWAVAHLAKRYSIEPVLPDLWAILSTEDEETDLRREAARALVNAAGSSAEKATERLAELDALQCESSQIDQLRAKLLKVIGKKKQS